MDRKQQILEIGLELLQTRGYASFSYADLSERLGITKASIHHHFPSKEDLGVALTQRYFEVVRETLDEAAEHDDPWEQFEGYAGVVFGAFGRGDRICAAGSVQSEYNVVPESMRQSMGELIEYVIDWIAQVLEEGRRRGVMQFPGSPEEQATMIFSTMQGALQYGRAQGKDELEAIVRQVKENLRAAA